MSSPSRRRCCAVPEKKVPGGGAGQAWRSWVDAGSRREPARNHLLLLREERLLEERLPEERLVPLALARSLRLELLELRLLLRPLEAVPRLLLLRDEDDPGREEEEEEELRDAIACSLARLMNRPLFSSLRPLGQSRQTRRGNCRHAQSLRVGIALPLAIHPMGTALQPPPLPYLAEYLQCGTVGRALKDVVGKRRRAP